MRSFASVAGAIKQTLLLGGVRVAHPYGEDEGSNPKASQHWRRKGFKQEEIDAAFATVMTGPKATRPRWKTLRRVIKQIRAGVKPGRNVPYKRKLAAKKEAANG